MLQPTPVIVAAAAPFDRDVERGLGRIGESAPDLPAGLDPDGPEIARLVAMAGDLVVCAGYAEAGPAGHLYSSAVCVTGDGILGHQRKVHLPPAERFAYTAGDSFAAFDTPAGRIGMLLCYDKLFPEAARALEAFLVGNGEVYNHEHVRSRLEGRDILTTSDNEVALHLIDEFGQSLPNVVRSIESFDPGLVRSAVPNYMLARMTRQHVRVVLTGEGADELFAGYDYLREFTDPERLHEELERTVRSLHNLNLQRCDRVTMAHAVEARVPFLDREVIAWALRVPASAKLAGPGQPEKSLLREAFDGWLPDDLLWREKAEFGDGSGARDVLTQAVEATVTDGEFAAERDAVEPPLRTKEELAYYRVWREHLQGISAERTLSRFARA